MEFEKDFRIEKYAIATPKGDLTFTVKFQKDVSTQWITEEPIKETDDLAEAAKSWLTANPHFAAAAGPGAGEKSPASRTRPRSGGSGDLTPETIEKSNPSDLVTRGMAAAAEASARK